MELRRLTSTYSNRDMIAYVTDDGDFYFAGSVSGPIIPAFVDRGTLSVGDAIELSYDYDADDFATRDGWRCTVKRINRKTVTVVSVATGESHRIEL